MKTINLTNLTVYAMAIVAGIAIVLFIVNCLTSGIQSTLAL